MSLTLAKKLREKRANLHAQANAILAKAETESRALSSEENTSFDKIDAEMTDLRTQIDKIEAHEARSKELDESAGRAAGGQNEGAETRGDTAKAEQRHNDAFKSWIRHGMNGLTGEQRSVMTEHEARALSVGTNSAGGYTVAPAFYAKLTEALLSFGGMRSVAQILSTDTGATMPFPTDNDPSNEGVILAENAQAAQQDITFGSVNIGAFMYTSKIVLVPLQLLQDSAFDIETYLARKLAMRIGRVTNRHFTVGTGGGTQPNGAVTAATLGKTGLVGQTTSVIYDDLVDLEHAVDPAYRENAVFMFHDNVLKTLKKLKDSQGRPLWLPGIAAKEPDTINGKKYVINQHMPVPAANAKSILFGDFSNYIIRDVMGVTVLQLRERYADFAQVGFVAFARADGNLVDAGTHPLAYYANSAT